MVNLRPRPSNSAVIAPDSKMGKRRRPSEKKNKPSENTAAKFEHILPETDQDGRSLEKYTKKLWVYRDDVVGEKKKVYEDVAYLPGGGLYKIFNEVYFNPAVPDPKFGTVKAVVDPEGKRMDIYRNVFDLLEAHRYHGLCVPEARFAEKLLSSINLEDCDSKVFCEKLCLFSLEELKDDLHRSIPSVVDGLRPCQRKVLFWAFKSNYVWRFCLVRFGWHVHYNFGKNYTIDFVSRTIIGMAQDFVGSNNINLFVPYGYFGTRKKGGKDQAHWRYFSSCLADVVRFVFPDEHLSPNTEPKRYAPIIPLVLVTGSEGIASGWSSFIPKYNPIQVISNLKKLLNNKPMAPIHPWYRGFKGRIDQTTEDTYTASGIIEKVDDCTLRITELPVGCWGKDYEQFLESLTQRDEEENPQDGERFIKGFLVRHDVIRVEIEVSMDPEKLCQLSNEELLNKFRLTTLISTANMYLFDRTGMIKRYANVSEIIYEFYEAMVDYYKTRKNYKAYLRRKLNELEEKCRLLLQNQNKEVICPSLRVGEETFGEGLWSEVLKDGNKFWMVGDY